VAAARPASAPRPTAVSLAKAAMGAAALAADRGYVATPDSPISAVPLIETRSANANKSNANAVRVGAAAPARGAPVSRARDDEDDDEHDGDDDGRPVAGAANSRSGRSDAVTDPFKRVLHSADSRIVATGVYEVKDSSAGAGDSSPVLIGERDPVERKDSWISNPGAPSRKQTDNSGPGGPNDLAERSPANSIRTKGITVIPAGDNGAGGKASGRPAVQVLGSAARR